MQDLNQNKIDNYLYEAESLYNIVGTERQAIEIYSKVLKIAPKNLQALYSRAELYNLLGDYDKALADLNFANNINPDDFAVLILRCKVYLALSEYVKALADLDLANDNKPKSFGDFHFDLPKDFGIAFLRARSNYYIGNYQLAVDDSEYGIRLLEEFLERTKSEISLEQHLDRQHTYINSYIIRGHAYVAVEEYDKALRDYSYAINIINRSIEQENYKPSKVDVNDEVEFVRLNRGKWQNERYHLFADRCEVYIELGNLEKALEDCNLARLFAWNPISYSQSELKETPLEELRWDLTPHAYFGRIQFGLGNYKEAINGYNFLDIIDQCKEATKKNNPKSIHSSHEWNDWAIALSFEQRGLSYSYLEDFELAINDLSKAASLYHQCNAINDCERIVAVIKSINEVKLLSNKLASEGFYNEANEEISRERATTSILRRRGQPKFRQDLLEAYDYCCAITGCSSVDALEAAHIIFYNETQNNKPTNGLLLRADIHTLFDCDLIAIDPDTMTVCVAPNLLKDYGEFNNKSLRLPKNKKLAPNIEALKSRYEKYQNQTRFLKSAWIKITT